MKKSIIFIALALLCLNFYANGQGSPTDPFQKKDNKATEYMLGTKLPDSFWKAPHTFLKKGETFTQDLEAYKDKLVILDFWATWCTVCRRKLPVLDSLQKIYPKELAVIPINSVASEDRMENILNVLSGKFKPFIAYELSTVINDVSLNNLFPHRQLSHVVWIQDGSILAYTGSDFIDAKMIEKMILENRAYRNKVEKSKKQVK